MKEDIDVGEIQDVEIQQKRWPKFLIVISVIISLMMICLQLQSLISDSENQSYVITLMVVAYWLLFILCQQYRFTRKNIFQFGDKGCIRLYLKNGTVKKTSTILYKMIQPKFSIIDFKVNGSHTYYSFTVDFGSISLSYSYNYEDEPISDFNYICAHKLYRYWSKYVFGQEIDYNESVKIVMADIK